MKKGLLKGLVVGAVASMMAVSLVGCGSKSDSATDNSLKAIQDKDKVIVGLSADYAPYEFHAMVDGKDQIVGFDVELAKEISKDLGVELEIKEMEFEALIGALQAGQIDMIISGMNPDDKRKQAIDFSEIYYVSQHGVLVNKNDVDKYKEVADLAGKKIGAQLGSTQQGIAQDKVDNAQLTLLANVNNLVLELKTGKIDALITEKPVAEMAMKSNDTLALCPIEFKEESGGNAVGMQKGSKALTEAVNKTIKRLQDSGELNKFIMDANDLAAAIAK